MFTGKTRTRDLPQLSLGDLAEIQQWARSGLSKEEILCGYSTTWESFSPAERSAFDEHFNLGRAQGLHMMSDALFQQARSKGGTAAAIAFLARFSKTWTKDDEAAINSGGFTFNLKI